MIPFNKIHITGNETEYINNALQNGKISGNGPYTNACEAIFEKRYGFKKALLTSSCTDALELAALLIGLQPGDEVIMPSYSFVSMANAFILRGVKIIFADSSANDPNIDTSQIPQLITPRTKAIVVIHYGGIACDIDTIRAIADEHGLYLIEDAAHAIDSYYKDKPLGSFGHLSAFSFHETKNITCGEGGMLVINDETLIDRAEIMREKGTDQALFLRKEVPQYSWVDVGASYLTSDITAAFLYAQLSELDDIQQKRKKIWQQYYTGFEELAHKGSVKLPHIPDNPAHNAHIFYMVCPSHKIRNGYIDHMVANGVRAQFHYITLHDSPYYKHIHGTRELPMAKFYQECLVRLPLFYDLTDDDMNKIISLTYEFFSR